MGQKDALDALEKRAVFLEKQVQVHDEAARQKTRNRDKSGSLLCLQKKKMVNGEIDNVNKQRSKLEKQIMNLEAQKTQSAALEALQTGVQTQKHMNAKMNIDSVDQLMEDMQ